MTLCATATEPEIVMRLTVSKAGAVRHLKQRIEHGVAIRRRRVRYVEDLESARADKAAWIQSYSDLLRQLFHGEVGAKLAERCNDWTGRVYPEYAETALFVEQFYDEMDYRVSRLRAVAHQIAGMPETIPVPTSTKGEGDGRSGLIETGSGLSEVAARAASSEAAKREDAMPVATVEEVAANAPAAPSSGLFVTRGDPSPAQDSIRKFLRDLGIALLDVPLTRQHGKTEVAALEHDPAAAFAILLLGAEEAATLRTPGGCSAAVAFQLGYLVGRLGVARVCVLSDGGTDVFHDEHGVLCLPLDPAQGWHLQLARHLKRAGMEVDLNKLC